MRLFHLCLVAALVTAASAKPTLGKVKQYTMPGGFPDGSIITFYFLHAGDASDLESVDINFYDVPSIPKDEVYDITAHLRIDRNSKAPVTSDSYENGKWLNRTFKDQPLDENPPQHGWWRVDVVKHDKHHLNVFFQGFWSDVRTFTKSLDNVQSIYVMKNVDTSNVQIRIKYPNANIASLSVDQFNDHLYGDLEEKNLITLPVFPIGARIEMTAVLAASGGERDRSPALNFNPEDSVEEFLSIFQKWEDGTESLYVHSNSEGILCTNEKPNGDLQHLNLERISQDTVRLHVMLKQNRTITCDHTLPPYLAAMMDEPFDIRGEDGAMLFHLDHTIPRSVVQKEN